MAFVNEKEKLRAIDYERNAVLYDRGGVERTNITNFELHWNGVIIKFGAALKKEKDELGKYVMNWDVLYADIPSTLDSEKNTIRQLIFEALDEYGFLFRRAEISKVNVVLSPRVSNL